jgi:two-component system sensor histidine kinase/response regulator
MSHEIRTPMNAIIGISQMALMKKQSAENTEMYKKISSAAKTLLSIINDILDFSKIEAEKLKIVEEEFLLEDTVSNVFLVATEHIGDKPVEVLFEAAADVPAALRGDKSRIWQILKNLLDNSVKYTVKGHVLLSVSVADKKTPADIALRFAVKDTGVGMSREQLSRLFDPFEQFHRDTTKVAGTGLGMSITKSLTDLLNGSISVSSEVAQGTTFEVVLPFKLPENPRSLLKGSAEALGAQLEKAGPVLLIDREPASLKIMSDILKNVNVESVSASDGDTALTVLRERENNIGGAPFKVAALAYDFGEGADNGIILAGKIKKIAGNIKLLMVTAYMHRVLQEKEIRAAGFHDVIEKPFLASSFLRKLCSAVPEKEGAGNSGHPPKPAYSFPDARVLLVEDNEINQMVAAGLMESFDVVPVIANNGREALEWLERQEFDLVLMDIVMPVMDGHEAVAAIRGSDKPYRDVPVIAMTANVMSDEVAQYLSEGMDGHLEKPIDVYAFQAALVKHLS